MEEPQSLWPKPSWLYSNYYPIYYSIYYPIIILWGTEIPCGSSYGKRPRIFFLFDNVSEMHVVFVSIDKDEGAEVVMVYVGL